MLTNTGNAETAEQYARSTYPPSLVSRTVGGPWDPVRVIALRMYSTHMLGVYRDAGRPMSCSPKWTGMAATKSARRSSSVGPRTTHNTWIHFGGRGHRLIKPLPPHWPQLGARLNPSRLLRVGLGHNSHFHSAVVLSAAAVAAVPVTPLHPSCLQERILRPKWE
jgi:hypothetical protein